MESLLKYKSKFSAHLLIVFSICLIISCKKNSIENNKIFTLNQQNISSKYNGNFEVSTETEATTTGMASITYYFMINKNGAYLKTNTYHEPIRCNGKYLTKEKNDMLELYYNEKDSACVYDYPNFIIKKINNKYFIQGVGNEAMSIEWVEIEKK